MLLQFCPFLLLLVLTSAQYQTEDGYIGEYIPRQSQVKNYQVESPAIEISPAGETGFYPNLTPVDPARAYAYNEQPYIVYNDDDQEIIALAELKPNSQSYFYKIDTVHSDKDESIPPLHLQQEYEVRNYKTAENPTTTQKPTEETTTYNPILPGYPEFPPLTPLDSNKPIYNVRPIPKLKPIPTPPRYQYGYPLHYRL